MNETTNIALCFPVEQRHVEQISDAARQVGLDATVNNAGQEGIAQAILEADIFCGHAKVPVDWPAVVSKGKLKWIQSSAAGLDHCLVPAVLDSDIRVTSCSGLFAPQVAEQTMALLLATIRSMNIFFEAQQKKEYIRRPTNDLKGKIVGIVGFGGNGRRIAEVLHPFGVTIVATDVFVDDKPDFVEALWPTSALGKLLESSDIVILTLPLVADTHHYLSNDEFSMMKPGAILINVARGAVVDEAAMTKALQSGHLGAAALDVVEVEPLVEQSVLWEMPNVIITPHVGAQSAERVNVTTDLFCENLRRWVEGEKLVNDVDKALGFPGPESRLK